MKKAKAGLEDVLQSLKEPLESAEYRFSVGREDFSDYAQRILEDMQQWAQEDRDKIGISLVKPNYEGVRIRFDSPGLAGWCLMRKSLHDPKMPLNIEVTEGSCGEILDVISDFLKSYDVSL